jgi:CheY-like chemotaxis protein
MADKPIILLIDDDQALLHMYSLKFAIDGSYELLTADNPDIGLTRARGSNPVLILLDLVLPKSGQSLGWLNKEIGFHVLEELKRDERTAIIPVVILTNLDEKTQGNVERAKEFGAIDYWVKANVKPAEVIERINRILHR